MRPAPRGRLREALRTHYPWVDEDRWGPRSVPAGECDRCETNPRLVPTCGPVGWIALCRPCVLEVGADAWCGGHAPQGEAMLAAVRELPDEWRTVTILWWVATGEVRLDSAPRQELTALPSAILASIGNGSD